MKASAGNPCVLIIVENLPVPLDRRVWQESCALRDAGYKVVVICPKMKGYDASEEVLDGIHIYRHWISEEGRGLFGFLREYSSALWGEFRLVWKVWKKHKFQIVHLCNPPDLLFLNALPFKVLGVKVLYDVHDLWPEMFEAKFQKRGLLYWLVRWAERLTYSVSDVVLATNQTVRSVALRRGRKKESEVFVVRTAPKIAGLECKPDSSLKRGKKYLAGYVGVMGNSDGIDYLLKAIHHLVYGIGNKDIHFMIMGSGPEYESLLKLRQELELEHWVEMPGRVSNEFLFTTLQTMDFGISCDPINEYNHGCTMNKVLEYMAFGKPQVLFDLNEGRASAGESAVYVDENSPVKLAEAMNWLLNHPEERARMGELGKKRLNEHLNWGKSVEELLAAYSCLLPASSIMTAVSESPTVLPSGDSRSRLRP
jgi:glycosyltransferase involved in cell wall biosynthesis